MSLVLCQVNSCAGNVARNVELVLDMVAGCGGCGGDLFVFPELVLPGACVGDCFLDAGFVAQCDEGLRTIDEFCKERGVTAVVGTVKRSTHSGGKLRNALCVVGKNGGARFDKMTLVSDDVLDEHRYFEADDVLNAVWLCPQSGLHLGIAHWADRHLLAAESFRAAMVDQVLFSSACAFEVGAGVARIAELDHTAALAGVPVALVNAAGGGDHVVYDGGSCVALPDGSRPAMCRWFAPDCAVWNPQVAVDVAPVDAFLGRVGDPTLSVLDALTLGLTDYMSKCGFEKVLIGNSGGIDSALTAALAARAIGGANVITVTMPGPFTSDATRSDSDELARRLGVQQLCVPIGAMVGAVESAMFADEQSAPVQALFGGDAAAVNRLAGENVQSRLRGLSLMWISNALGGHAPALVLSTGNKSEAAVGYCTLYGDTCGGLNLIGDLTKGMVYAVARAINAEMGEVIAQSIIDREPSAELAPNQKDSDSLPPYPVLDGLVEQMVELGKTPEEAAAVVAGATPDVARRVARMIAGAEYKRKQVAACVRVTRKAFGVGRRMPLARGKMQ